MFKTILGVLLVVGVMYIIVDATFNNEVVYEREVTTEVETVEVNILQKRIEEALEANRENAEAKAQEAYDKIIAAEEKRITEETKIAYIKEIEATLSSE